jgi:hypothetical protein
VLQLYGFENVHILNSFSVTEDVILNAVVTSKVTRTSFVIPVSFNQLIKTILSLGGINDKNKLNTGDWISSTLHPFAGHSSSLTPND